VAQQGNYLTYSLTHSYPIENLWFSHISTNTVLQMQQAQLGQQPPLPQTLAMPSLLAPPPPPPVADCRIYVGSLNYDLKEADIKALFASFGAIRSFTMSYDNVTGKSKGYCFVEYESPESAVSALVRTCSV
jgi:hypothetical protein